MPSVKIYSLANQEVGEVELLDSVFAAPLNRHLVWEAVNHYMAKGRAGTASTKVRSEVADLLEGLRASRTDFDYELTEINSVLPSMTDRDAPIVQTVTRAIEDIMGKTPEYVASPGTYDQKHIDRIGKLKNCIAYGPGILELAHKPDEYIAIDDMVESACVMGAALQSLLLPRS